MATSGVGIDLIEIARIERALQRIDAGTYGRCQTCGEDIAPGRLEALPDTPTCVGCAAIRRRARSG